AEEVAAAPTDELALALLHLGAAVGAGAHEPMRVDAQLTLGRRWLGDGGRGCRRVHGWEGYSRARGAYAIPRRRRNSRCEGSRPRKARTMTSASREPFGSRISRR